MLGVLRPAHFRKSHFERSCISGSLNLYGTWNVYLNNKQLQLPLLYSISYQGAYWFFRPRCPLKNVLTESIPLVAGWVLTGLVITCLKEIDSCRSIVLFSSRNQFIFREILSPEPQVEFFNRYWLYVSQNMKRQAEYAYTPCFANRPFLNCLLKKWL